MENKVEMMSQNSLLECFEQVFPVAANLNEEYNKIAKEGDEKEDDIFQKMLQTQISSMKGLEEINEKEQIAELESGLEDSKKEEEQNVEQTDTQEEISLAQENLPTQVITQNPLSENFNVQYGNVKIKNQIYLSFD